MPLYVLDVGCGTVVSNHSSNALRPQGRTFHRTLGLREARLMRVIARDQLTYASIILICGIFNLVDALDLSSPAPVQVLYCTIGNTSILSLVGGRMLINLKQAAEETPGEGGSPILPTHPSTDVFRTISTSRESVLGQSHDSAQPTPERAN